MSHQIYLAVYDRSGNRAADLLNVATGLTLETVSNGGCSLCRFRLPRKATLLYPDLDYNFDVRASDAHGVFWRGKIEEITPALEEHEEYLEIVALGGAIAADDQIYTSKTFSAGTSINAAVSAVRTDLMAGIVTAEDLVTASRTITVDTTFTGVRARTVLDRLTAFGMSGDLPLQWAVWPDGAGSAYQLVLEARPTTPAYTVNVLDLRHQGGFSGGLYYNRVRVNYNSGASWRMVEDTAEQTLTGRTREYVISAPELTSTTDVDNVGATALTLVKQRRVQARSGTVSGHHAVHDTDRQVVPLWRVRAGKLLYIQGRMSSGQAGATDWANTAFIKATRYDDDTGALDLTFESDQATLEGVVARLTKLLEV